MTAELPVKAGLPAFWRMVVILAGLALAACGDGSSSPATVGGAGQSASTQPAATVAAPDVNLAPTIEGTPATTVVAGEVYEFSPDAGDPEGEPLLFSVSNPPDWTSFDPVTGLLAGTPGVDDVGTVSGISISVTDGVNVTTLPAFAVTVHPLAPRSATLSWLPPTENTDGSTVADLAGFRIYYGTTAGAYGQTLLVTDPGTTSFMVENLAPGTWHFAMSALDLAGQESALSQEVVHVVL